MKSLRVAIVGCGNVARAYVNHISRYDNVELLGFQDIDNSRADAFAQEHGGNAYASLDDVLADPQVDLVVNLTIHHAHVEVITKCLEAGKHVHTEKPLAMTYAEARQLVALAEAKGLRLSSAPITFLGEPAQAAFKVMRDGRCGEIRVIYAEVNHGRIESWHPNPGPFYQVGPLYDVGIYPLSLITAHFGPAQRVRAFHKVVYPHRETNEGKPFTIETPEFGVAIIELKCGTVVRLTFNFYILNSKQGGAIEFHGDTGSVRLGNFQDFKAGVEYEAFGHGSETETIPSAREVAEHGAEFGRGVEEMAFALAEGRPSRATGEHAAHVIEILEAITTSANSDSKPVELESTFTPPAPMPWA